MIELSIKETTKTILLLSFLYFVVLVFKTNYSYLWLFAFSFLYTSVEYLSKVLIFRDKANLEITTEKFLLSATVFSVIPFFPLPLLLAHKIRILPYRFGKHGFRVQKIPERLNFLSRILTPILYFLMGFVGLSTQFKFLRVFFVFAWSSSLNTIYNDRKIFGDQKSLLVNLMILIISIMAFILFS